jgi:putative serine/threonine protein kinase
MVEVIKIEDERLKVILSYPIFKEEFYNEVLRELREMGINELISRGRVNIGKINVIGKGCTSIVVQGLRNNNIIALKILRVDSNRESVLREGRILSIVNREGIGPKLIDYKNKVIAMEYIEGEYISNWLKREQDNLKMRMIIKDLLEQCYKLDLLGIFHKELSNPKTHIIIRNEEKPVIIDFETISLESKNSNLSSIIGYLFFSNSKILEKIIKWDSIKLRELVKEYKKTRSNYNEILRFLGL